LDAHHSGLTFAQNLPGLASFFDFCQFALFGAQCGHQVLEFLQIERGAAPLPFRLDARQTSQQKAAHAEADLHYRERHLAELLRPDGVDTLLDILLI